MNVHEFKKMYSTWFGETIIALKMFMIQKNDDLKTNVLEFGKCSRFNRMFTIYNKYSWISKMFMI